MPTAIEQLQTERTTAREQLFATRGAYRLTMTDPEKAAWRSNCDYFEHRERAFSDAIRIVIEYPHD